MQHQELLIAVVDSVAADPKTNRQHPDVTPVLRAVAEGLGHMELAIAPSIRDEALASRLAKWAGKGKPVFFILHQSDDEQALRGFVAALFGVSNAWQENETVVALQTVNCWVLLVSGTVQLWGEMFAVRSENDFRFLRLDDRTLERLRNLFSRDEEGCVRIHWQALEGSNDAVSDLSIMLHDMANRFAALRIDVQLLLADAASGEALTQAQTDILTDVCEAAVGPDGYLTAMCKGTTLEEYLQDQLGKVARLADTPTGRHVCFPEATPPMWSHASLSEPANGALSDLMRLINGLCQVRSRISSEARAPLESDLAQIVELYGPHCNVWKGGLGRSTERCLGSGQADSEAQLPSGLRPFLAMMIGICGWADLLDADLRKLRTAFRESEVSGNG